MPRYLSWNVYHGALGGITPSQRIQQIVTLGMANAVDVICLQEVPQAILDPVVGFGLPGAAAPIVQNLNNNVANWGAYYALLQALAEDNPNGPNHANTSDGYLIFVRTATFNNYANFGYYHANQFVDLTGSTLRPPVSVDLTLAPGGMVTVMNWHADVAAPQVVSALVALNNQLGNGNAQPHLTLVLGDYNYAGPLNNALAGIGNPFPNWDDWHTVITDNVGNVIADGLDHILTSQPSQQALAGVLTFKSDAYHYPLAVDA